MELEPLDLSTAGDADMGIDYTEGENEVDMTGGGPDVFDEGDADMGVDDYAPFEDEADMREWNEIDGAEAGESEMTSNFADGVTIVTGAPPPTDTSPTVSSEAPRPPHPGFASPPAVVTSEDGLQVSAMGHSAIEDHLSNPLPFSHTPDTLGVYGVGAPVSPPRHAPQAISSLAPATENRTDLMSGGTDLRAVDHADPQSSSIPQSHSRHDLNGSKALAAQHQKTEDGKQKQEQSVESRGPGEIRVHQSQSQERASDEEDVSQENEVTIRQRKNSINGALDHLDVDMDQINRGGHQNGNGPVNQINHVKVIKRDDDCASGTLSGGTAVRPDINKKLLTAVDLSNLFPSDESDPDPNEEEPDEEETKALAAPTVLLTYNNETYSLFRSTSAQEGTDDPAGAPLLFGERKEHELYYDQIESLFEALHEALPDLTSRDDELVLSFDDIGISLSEDNVYTREVNLYDFDRIHVGCGLPGRLHFRVEQQPRFSTGFNALAQHIANSFNQEDEDVQNHPEVKEETKTEQDAEQVEEKDEDAFKEEAEVNEEAEPTVANEIEHEGADETFEEGEWFDAAAEGDDGEEQGEPPLQTDEVNEEAGEELVLEAGVGGEEEPPETGGEKDVYEDVPSSEGQTGDDYFEEPHGDAGSTFANDESTAEAQYEGTSMTSGGPSTTSSRAPSHVPSISTTPSSSDTSAILASSVAGRDVAKTTTGLSAVEDVAEELDHDSEALDVVIDYEEAFDPASPQPFPLPAVMVPVPATDDEGPLSPKRGLDDLLDAKDRESAPASGQSKRARRLDAEGSTTS